MFDGTSSVYNRNQIFLKLKTNIKLTIGCNSTLICTKTNQNHQIVQVTDIIHWYIIVKRLQRKRELLAEIKVVRERILKFEEELPISKTELFDSIFVGITKTNYRFH